MTQTYAGDEFDAIDKTQRSELIAGMQTVARLLTLETFLTAGVLFSAGVSFIGTTRLR